MAKSTTTKLDVDTLDRLELVKQAGYQVTAIAELMKQPISRMRHEWSHTEEVALSLLMDRLELLGEAIADLGEDDLAEDDQDRLGELLCLSVERPPDEVSE